jgi:putative selenate reductase
VITDPESRATNHGRVYAGGDVTRGPEIIIAACEDGRRAAEAICQQLGREFRPPFPEVFELTHDDILHAKQVRARKSAQHESEMLPVAQRAGFACVEQTLSEEDARAEAARCLQCATFCDKCVEVCPNRANYSYQVEPVSWKLPVLACQDGSLAAVAEETFEVTQTRQILHVDDFCNECGNCATFCVHQGKPYLEKPRLFLEEDEFLVADENAYYWKGDTLRRREGGREVSLLLQDGWFVFENKQARVRVGADWKIKGLDLKEAFEGTMSLKAAAEMVVILKGIAASLPQMS